MRITTFLLLISVLTVSANSFAQKITLNEKRASLEQVFAKIRQQSGVDIIYSSEALEKATPVTLRLTDVSLDEALKAALLNQPLVYEIEDGTVLIRLKETGLSPRIADVFAAIDVRGRIVDEQGKVIPGATVRLKSGKLATITDVKGEFVLKGVNEGEVLQVTFIGYNMKEVAAAADLGTVQMEVATSKLDEVQVQAYSKTSQRLSTGNIGTVKAADIEKQPVNNPLLAMQGRIPGVTIEQSTGMANSGVKIRIQGQNSLANGNDPLYVIDGVPYTSQLLPSISNVLGQSSEQSNAINGTGNPLSFINPSDIESISVLKDADATSIYGSRAANGAILITTKKGKVGKTEFRFNSTNGIGQVSKKVHLLNTQQYLSMRKEAYQNDGLATPNSATPSDLKNVQNYDLTVWDQNRYTDWQDQLIGGTAKYTDLQTSIGGGNESTQFLISGGYHKETTVFPGSNNDQKGSVHVNLSHSSLDKKIKLNFTVNYLVDFNRLPLEDLTSAAFYLAPNAPALYNSDGSLNFEQFNGISTWNNPLRSVNTISKNNTKNLISNLQVSYELAPGLTIKTSFGYTDLQTFEYQYLPEAYIAPEERPTNIFFSDRSNGFIRSWISEPQISYKLNTALGNFDALFGSTLQQQNGHRDQIGSYGFASEQLVENLSAAPNVYGSTTDYVYRYSAFFASLNYNFSDKYIVNFNARRDGSSRFGANNSFHSFGSIAGAWVFSNEEFVKDRLSFLSFGKIRASYGTTGNDQIDNYKFLSLYRSNSYNQAYQGISGLTPDGLPNPNLQWEETHKLQFGIDLGLFKERILLNASVFKNRSSNQLIPYNLPSLVGFDNLLRNFPATIENTGLELSLNSLNIHKKKFYWSSNFNITIPKNKVIEFPGLETSPYSNSLFIGQPITIQKTYNYSGVNPQTGLYEFVTANGQLSSDPTFINDRTVLINLSPKFYGGFQNTVSFKAISLDFLIQFVKQVGLNALKFGRLPGLFQTNSNGNQPIEVLGRWTTNTNNGTIQQFSSNYSGIKETAFFKQSASNVIYEDASFIRLKNISFTWNMPEEMISKLKLKNLRLFLQGQNLLTVTKYKGLDPETKSSTSLPPLRIIAVGLQIGL